MKFAMMLMRAAFWSGRLDRAGRTSSGIRFPTRHSRSPSRCRSPATPRLTMSAARCRRSSTRMPTRRALQAYGDTKTQTVGVLNKIKGILDGLGLGMGDVVKMQVFLVHNARGADGFQGLHGRLHAVFRRQPAEPAGALRCRRRGARQSRISGRDRGDCGEGRQIEVGPQKR